MTTRKLYHLIGPIYSGVFATTRRPRDADEKAGGQIPAYAEIRGLRARGQRDQVWSPNQEVLSHETKT